MSQPEDSDNSASRTDGAGEADPSVFSGEDAETVLDPVSPPSSDDALETARKEAAENFERFLRAKADYENVVKRHQRELADRARYDGESLARDILQSVDDLQRALEHAGDASGVTGGIEMVLKGLLAALKRNGVERIEAQGKPFDPSEHEAVTMVATDEVPPNTVVAEFRAGYRMRDRLLRAAMVSVSRAPDSKATSEG